MSNNVQTTPRLALIVSSFNEEVTSGLRRGATAYLEEQNLRIPDELIYSAPGAFEIPLIARAVARSGRVDGVICLGCVIKGDTAHFEYISQAASNGLMGAALETGIPISFGILTTYTDDQAVVRSRDDEHNKGREAAAACLEAARLLQTL